MASSATLAAGSAPSPDPALQAAGQRYGYGRLSKDRSLRGISIAIQHAEVDDYAERTGEAVTRFLYDNDKSASEFGTKPRDGYIELVACVMRGLVREIIVTEVPRLCRQVEEALEFIKLSKTTALRSISTTDGMVYDLHTPRGRKTFRDAVSDAQFESDQTSTRQHRRSNKRAEAGSVHGGQRAYGYAGAVYEQLVTPDGERLNGRLLNPGAVGVAIVEEEAEVIREAVARIIAGERLVDLVRDFNQRGIPAAQGGRWRTQNIKRLLCRRRFVAFEEFPGKGTRIHKGRAYRAVWEAIISKEDHELMLAAFKMRAGGRTAHKLEGRNYLLSGLTVCTHPGHGPMYGASRQMRNGVLQRRYGCQSSNGYGEHVPGPKTFRGAEPVELLVTEAVLAAFETPRVAAALAPQENRERVTELVALHTKQQAHLQQLVVDYGASMLTRDEFVIARQTAQAALAATEAELGKLQKRTAATNLSSGQTLREAFAKASVGWRRQVISLVVEKVIIRPSGPGRTIWRGYQFNPDDVEIVWKA